MTVEPNSWTNFGMQVMLLVAVVEMRVKVGVMWAKYLKDRNGN